MRQALSLFFQTFIAKHAKTRASLVCRNYCTNIDGSSINGSSSSSSCCCYCCCNNFSGVCICADCAFTAQRFIIVACGTSWHAGLVGEYIFEELTRIPVEVEYASEFRYRNPIINENDVVLAISQSGETADTLAALELAKEKGATVLGICNVVGSTIARSTHAGSYTHAGPEIGVASTKAFTAQITVLTLMALSIAKKKGTITN